MRDSKGRFVKGHKTNIGRKFPGSNVGEKNPFFGKKHTENTKRKISKVLREKEIGFTKGYRPWNYTGSHINLLERIRKSFLYRQWRSDVFTRDDFTCQNCGERGGRLNADHHPKMFIEVIVENNITNTDLAIQCSELWNINNGRTLCRECHIKIGKKTSHVYEKRRTE